MSQEHTVSNIESLSDVSKQTVQTALGPIVVNKQKDIQFPNGIAGFPNARTLYLADLPEGFSDEYSGFKILQSLENKELSFLVYPVQMESGIYEIEDLNLVCEMLDTNPNHTSILLIVSTHFSNEKEQLVLTYNARAPIMVNRETNAAYQYIFTHVKYPIQKEF